ncbi:MAG TPA: ammonium transporter [Dehalococcoidia bacterium]|nr:ammonium transporter [Dehalococcoidia bacterium]
MNSGDTAWMLISAALVMLMTPGLALFYGGLTRSKNVLGTIMQSFIMLGVISVQFAVIGFSLAFGPDHGGLIGDFHWVFLHHVSPSSPGPYAPTVPAQTYMIFQMMFAVITPALITGAFAERAKFSTFVVFMLLWATLVYDPVAHWVWGLGGWLGSFPEANGQVGIKAIDFAGGTVVHINAGIAALVAAIMYGKRHGFGREPMEPHDITMVVIGAALLWFGWFGFNAGSALSALGTNSNGHLILTASNAFVVTHIATATAAVVWTSLSWMMTGKPSVVGAAAGAVAGLVAITPASGFVSPMGSIAIGGGAGAICYFAVRLRSRMGLDDSLDVVGVHGVGGAWGAIATGLFAVAAYGGVNGLFFGEPAQFARQLAAVGVTLLYSGTVTFVILKVLDAVMGLRVSEEDEIVGLDASQHGERAYLLDGGSTYAGIPVTPEPVAYAQQSTASNPAHVTS